jgi:hypothetical protein
MRPVHLVEVLAVLAPVVGACICKNDTDFQPALAPAALFRGGMTCLTFTERILTSLTNRLSFDEVTCADLAGLDQGLLIAFKNSGECCGGRHNLICQGFSTMCTNADHFQPHLAPAALKGATCSQMSAFIMQFLPNSLNWNDTTTCTDLASPYLGMHSDFMNSGECCGSRTKLRCTDSTTMCRFVEGAGDGDFLPNADSAIRGESMYKDSKNTKSGAVKCSVGDARLLASLAKMTWTDVTRDMLAKVKTDSGYSDNTGASGAVAIKDVLATLGPCCCRGVAGVCPKSLDHDVAVLIAPVTTITLQAPPVGRGTTATTRYKFSKVLSTVTLGTDF